MPCWLTYIRSRYTYAIYFISISGDIEDPTSQKSPTENADESLISQTNLEDAMETEQNDSNELSPTRPTEDWSLSVADPTVGDDDAYFTPPTAISALQFASLPTDTDENPPVSVSNAASKQVAIYSRSSESKKSKAQIANVFNPQVMTW